jgi:hypothetical protein
MSATKARACITAALVVSLTGACAPVGSVPSAKRDLQSVEAGGANSVLSVGWQLVSDWRTEGKINDNSSRKILPLGQGGRATGFVGLAIDEVAF